MLSICRHFKLILITPFKVGTIIIPILERSKALSKKSQLEPGFHASLPFPTASSGHLLNREEMPQSRRQPPLSPHLRPFWAPSRGQRWYQGSLHLSLCSTSWKCYFILASWASDVTGSHCGYRRSRVCARICAFQPDKQGITIEHAVFWGSLYRDLSHVLML